SPPPAPLRPAAGPYVPGTMFAPRRPVSRKHGPTGAKARLLAALPAAGPRGMCRLVPVRAVLPPGAIGSARHPPVQVLRAASGPHGVRKRPFPDLLSGIIQGG